MAFKPGQSGNPNGRPKTAAAAGRAALRDKLFKRIPAIIKKLEEQALAGDVQAARTLLERVLPAVKPESLTVMLPAVAQASTATEQSQLIVKAVALGELSPEAAGQLLSGIGQAARVADLDRVADEVRQAIKEVMNR